MTSRFIVGLDVGTSSIKVVVAERSKDDRPLVRYAAKEPSFGLRRGAIVDLGEVSQAVAKALAEVKKLARSALSNVYVSIGTPQFKMQQSQGIAAVSRVDTEIYQDDVDRVIRASQAVNLGPNRMVLHTVTQEYIVDGVGDIVDPLGLNGSRLEVRTCIIDGFAPHVKSLLRVVELTGGQIGGIVASPLAASRSVLTKRQKELGVLTIDIGCGTTGMSVYEENKLKSVAVFPFGAGNITNDLAVGLKIPAEAAEVIKVEHGRASAREIHPKEAIELKKFVPDARGSVPRRFIAEIIGLRLAEILKFVNNELKSLGRGANLAGGAVVTGGGAKLTGITDLVKQELKLSSRIGLAGGDEWGEGALDHEEFFDDPEFVNAFGLILWGAEQERWRGRGISRRRRLIDMFRSLLP